MVLNRKQSENKWYTTEAAVTTATQNCCYRITLFGKCKWIAYNALQQSMILILKKKMVGVESVQYAVCTRLTAKKRKSLKN